MSNRSCSGYVGRCPGSAVIAHAVAAARAHRSRRSAAGADTPTTDGAEGGAGSCWICYDSSSGLLAPCLCRGSMGLVHASCLQRWQQRAAADARGCTVCGFRYRSVPAEWPEVLRVVGKAVGVELVRWAVGIGVSISTGRIGAEVEQFVHTLCLRLLRNGTRLKADWRRVVWNLKVGAARLLSRTAAVCSECVCFSSAASLAQLPLITDVDAGYFIVAEAYYFLHMEVQHLVPVLAPILPPDPRSLSSEVLDAMDRVQFDRERLTRKGFSKTAAWCSALWTESMRWGMSLSSLRLATLATTHAAGKAADLADIIFGE
eukprot:Hpha_TRINITY_DN27113_c0_g1::TRINITY_DN27113_c0_g1_i1::g.29338::m.29338